MVLTDQLISEDITMVFPSIVCLGVSLPFDQVLQSLPSPEMAMISDGLDFIFFFSVNDIWGWPWEVGSVLFCFMVQG